MKAIPVYVGYDPREAIAFHTCANSIIRHASKPVAIIPVALNLFRDYEETHTDGSNHFIYTRFLVPHLQEYTGWAIFIDGDMIVRDDIVKLWELQNPYMDVMVVKHDYQTRMPVKYLGAKNEDYPRKNWSSVIQVIQIKNRDYDESVEPFVTFTVSNGNSLPRKLVMREQEFRDTYGHLFEEGEDNAL